jgi:hypothetical protein
MKGLVLVDANKQVTMQETVQEEGLMAQAMTFFGKAK